MSDPQVLHGGCLCGKVRYAITAAPDTPAGGPVSSLCNFICHCGNCKKASGTHMANTSMFRRDQFSLTLGAPAAYEDGNNDSENVLLRWFCRDCGSPLYITSPTTDSSFVTVASGTLDDGSGWWRPNTELYLGSKSHWLPELDLSKEEGIVERCPRGFVQRQSSASA